MLCRLIPSNIDYAQKQIKDLLERVLDMDASKRSVASRLYDYYKDPYLSLIHI